MVLVALASMRDPDLVATAIAEALKVRAVGGRQAPHRLAEYLRERQLVLLLDTCEHVAAAASLVATLLAACPRLKVLATGRAPLHVRGERVFPVAPLALPDLLRPPDVEHVAGCAAVCLLVERVQQHRPDFEVSADNAPALAAICRRLDGLPLAIELAAARLAYLAPAVLLARLEGASGQTLLQVLSGGPRDLPARQRSLREAMTWSYDLLDAGEQTLFRRLAVFAGGCSPEAAEAVCASPGPMAVDILHGLTSLVDKSLLRREAGDSTRPGCHGEPRFTMLRTVRAYALERLAESGEAEELRRRHAAYYRELADATAPEPTAPGQVAWPALLAREHDNLWAARQWAQESGDAQTGRRLGGATACLEGVATVAALPEQPERVA